MNWAHLVQALLTAATVFPLLLWWCDLLSGTQALAVLTGAFTAWTVDAFLQGDADNVALCAALTVTEVLVLSRRKERVRKNTTKSPDTDTEPRD
jgi:hypothetical protein